VVTFREYEDGEEPLPVAYSGLALEFLRSPWAPWFVPNSYERPFARTFKARLEILYLLNLPNYTPTFCFECARLNYNRYSIDVARASWRSWQDRREGRYAFNVVRMQWELHSAITRLQLLLRTAETGT
jgi:hypothetical protein